MILLVFLITSLVNEVIGYSMSISFCDGNRLVNLTHDQCPFGINFGESKPSCVCMKGAYRLWLDNCAIYDGFMDEGCSTLGQGDTLVSGLRLSGSISSLTNTTAAIFGLKETDYQVWDTYEVGSKVETLTNNIYVLNGVATFVENKICIQPKKEIPSEKQVCRIFRSDNPIWKPGYSTVEVAETCSETGVELKVQNCYDVMRPKEQSECSLACQNYSHHAGVLHGGPGWEGRDKLDRKKTEETDESCKTATIPKVRDEKNIYINRNLNRWAKLRQVREVDRPNLFNLMPKRSWGLFDIMKQIAQEKCPTRFVGQLFMDQAIDLFIMVHQGKGKRYPEVLSEDDFQSILGKLTVCKSNITGKPLPMYGMEKSDGCGAFDKLVGASIPHPPFPKNMTWINETLDIDQGFYDYNYHFVIEAAWKIVDMVQNICFDYFDDEYTLFHMWEQAMEKLFTREVRDLWFHPKIDVQVYQILLSPTAVTDLHNLELCIKAAYLTDPRLKRLERPKPFSSYFGRKKRSLEGIVTRVHDVYCQHSERDFQYPC